MLYFKNRLVAGQQLAEKLAPHANEMNAIITLGDGSVVVASEIVKKVPALITMLITEAIVLPGETDPIGYIDQGGTFVKNKLISDVVLENFEQEYHSLIEEQKSEKFREIVTIVGGDEFFPIEKLHDHNIIIVSDGFSNGPLLDSIVDLLKPIKVNKLIIATPVACITAVDRINQFSDENYCLGVAQYYLGADHYYTENALPTHKDVIAYVKANLANT